MNEPDPYLENGTLSIRRTSMDYFPRCVIDMTLKETVNKDASRQTELTTFMDRIKAQKRWTVRCAIVCCLLTPKHGALWQDELVRGCHNLVFATPYKLYLIKLFLYPLTTVPLSRTHINSTMNTIDKSVLMKTLKWMLLLKDQSI